MHKPSIFLGFLAGVVVVVVSAVLTLQPRLDLGILIIMTIASLGVLVIAAGVAGWQAHRLDNRPALAGAIVGGFVTVGSTIGNIIMVKSPAYMQILKDLPEGDGGLQLTVSAPTVGSTLSSLLFNILIATLVASLVARLASRNV